MKQKVKKHPNIRTVPEKAFWMNHGPIVNTFKRLAKVIEKDTTDVQFKYHVGKDRSDYADWVREVLYDEECAKKLSKIKTRKTALKMFDEVLKKYH